MRRFLQAASLLLLLAASLAAFAQVRAKRIILKDGSYQPATKWEIKGDRVRYYSAERFGWEELPTSLVDWPATEKYNAELSEPSAVTREVDAEAKAEREREDAAAPLVAPGMRLPANGGVFLLDVWQGEPQLAEVVQSGSEINKQTGRNILRAAINPIPSTKQTIELKGPHAQVQSHVDDPLLFANISNPDATPSQTAAGGTGRDLDQQPDRFRIVRVQAKKDARVVGNVKIALTGKTKEEQDFIKTTTAPVSGGWVKITPAEKLPPGEYALVEMLGPKEMNLYVWDFGVNPAAPQNPTAWKPNALPEVKTGTTESPVLNKRPPK